MAFTLHYWGDATRIETSLKLSPGAPVKTELFCFVGSNVPLSLFSQQSYSPNQDGIGFSYCLELQELKIHFENKYCDL